MTTKKAAKHTDSDLDAKIGAPLLKLEPFRELLGNVPNEKIAEMAGVPVAVVEAIAAGVAAEISGDAAAREAVGPQLAKALGVSVVELAAFMLAHGFVEPEEQPGQTGDTTKPSASGEAGGDPPAPEASPAEPSTAGEDDASTASSSYASQPGPGDASQEYLDDVSDEEPVPHSVRLTGSARLVREGKAFNVNFRDVYSGDRAAWLWERHRDLVEVYPLPKQ